MLVYNVIANGGRVDASLAVGGEINQVWGDFVPLWTVIHSNFSTAICTMIVSAFSSELPKQGLINEVAQV